MRINFLTGDGSYWLVSEKKKADIYQGNTFAFHFLNKSFPEVTTKHFPCKLEEVCNTSLIVYSDIKPID